MDCRADEHQAAGIPESRCREEEVSGLLATLFRIGRLAVEGLDRIEVCRTLSEILVMELDVEASAIALWDPRQERLIPVASFMLPGSFASGTEAPAKPLGGEQQWLLPESKALQVFRTGRPVFSEHPFDEEGAPEHSEAETPRCRGTVVGLPLAGCGVLSAACFLPRNLTPERRQDWTFVAKAVADAIAAVTPAAAVFPGDPSALSGSTGWGPGAAFPNSVRGASGTGCCDSLLETVFDRLADRVCLLDEQGCIVHLSGALGELLGAEPSRFRGTSPAGFFEDPDAFRFLLLQAGKAGRARLFGAALMDSAKTSRSADVVLTRLADTKKPSCGYLLIAFDRSREAVLTDNLIHTQKLAALGVMAGGIVHDFNNLLMTILGNTQLLHFDIPTEQARKRLHNIEMAANDASQILMRLKTFSKPDKKTTGKPSAIDVNEIIKDVVELTRPQWKNSVQQDGHRVEIELNLEPFCTAQIHAAELHEILTNLILNAIDAMPRGGTLRLRSSYEEHHVLIEVSDTGPGIAEEVESKIFDPFFTTKGAGNSGLGLTVCWNLANRYGGEIRVLSAPESGTVFQVRFPRPPGPGRAAAGSEGRATPGARRILIVDDDPAVLGIMKEMVGLEGHEVLATHDGREAIAMIEREDFDLALTDLGMPTVTGWDIARKVKEKDRTIPVVLITGWGIQYEDEDLSARGVDLVLSKPLGLDKLRAAIQSLL